MSDGPDRHGFSRNQKHRESSVTIVTAAKAWVTNRRRRNDAETSDAGARKWNHVIPIAEQAAALFYERLFELDPAIRPLFKSDMQEQGRKLMAMITTVVNGLAAIEELVPAIRGLGQRHADYGVMDQHYDTVAKALLWTPGQGLGSRFTTDVESAWASAYGILATTMKDAAAAKAA